MSLPLVLPTEREGLTLRQLTIEDAPAYFESVDNNREHLSQFGDETADKYPDLQAVQLSILEPKNPDKVRLGIWDEETFVGSINLTPDEDGKAAEIGYWLDGRHTGHGYATLATTAISRYAESKFERLYAEVIDGNEASVRVLERSGFYRTAQHAGKLIFEHEELPIEKTELATTKDLDELIPFLETAYSNTYPNDRGITRDMFESNSAFQGELKRYLREQLANPAISLFIARKDGKIVGTIGVRPMEDSATVELWGFYVAKNLHGTGLAQLLYKRAMLSEQVASAERMRLSVAKDAKRAKAFYDKEGFVVLREEDWDWPHWTSERPHNQYLVMQRDLGR